MIHSNVMRTPAGVTLLAVVGSVGNDLLEAHGVRLGTAIAVGVVVLPIAWRISKTWQQFIDRIDNIEKKLDQLPCSYSRKCPR